MRRKGSSGFITPIIIVGIATVTVVGVCKVSNTSLFDTSGDYVVHEAQKVSTEEFKKTCESIKVDELKANQSKYKGKPVLYNGKIVEIQQGTFGGSSVKIQIKQDTYIVADVNDDILNAFKGDKVEVFGNFVNIKESNSETIITIDAVRINEKD